MKRYRAELFAAGYLNRTCIRRLTSGVLQSKFWLSLGPPLQVSRLKAAPRAQLQYQKRSITMSDNSQAASSVSNLDQACINSIRFLAIDAVQKANSGHPGLPMGAAAMAYVLWTRFLKHNPANPDWLDRDRFVLSPGHGSMLLYSLLYLTGYNLPLDQIQQFRQWGSRTPGHPERFNLNFGFRWVLLCRFPV